MAARKTQPSEKKQKSKKSKHFDKKKNGKAARAAQTEKPESGKLLKREIPTEEGTGPTQEIIREEAGTKAKSQTRETNVKPKNTEQTQSPPKEQTENRLTEPTGPASALPEKKGSKQIQRSVMTEQNYAITIEFQSLAQGADATITLDTSGGSAWTIGETEIGINVSPTYGTASVALESFSITDSSVSVQANEAINLLNIQLSVLADPDANDGHPRIGGTLELPSGTSVVISSTASQSVLLGGSWCIDLPVTA